MKNPSNHRSRGFSLIETVIALFLTSAVLFAVASLTKRTLDSLNFLREKSQSMQSATLGCERLATEMREMISAPTIGATSIRFVKVNPNSAPALGNDFTDPSGSPPHLWARDYVAADQTIEVLYATSLDEKLQRSVDGGTAITVATNVNVFSVTPEAGPAGNFIISLTVNEKRRPITFTTSAYCPGVAIE